MFVQAGQGLAAAHAAGVIHHDFKPDNVLVGAGDRVKVADFGLARVAASTASTVSGELIDLTRSQEGVGPAASVASGSAASGSAASTSAAPTQASERGPVGTLAYMAPERHLARTADARSDQFSFCVALYEALYQQRPFTGADVAGLRKAVLYGLPADPPRATPVPARVAAVLRRGLSRAPEDRYRRWTRCWPRWRGRRRGGCTGRSRPACWSARPTAMIGGDPRRGPLPGTPAPTRTPGGTGRRSVLATRSPRRPSGAS